MSPDFQRRSRLASRFVVPALVLALVAPGRAQPPDTSSRVSVGEIDERRSSERGDGRFRVDLRLFDSPPNTQRVRAQVDRAVDDKGRDLSTPPEDVIEWSDFGDDEVPQARWKGHNPTRGALKIAEMSGVMEAFVPTPDPDATLVLADWGKYLGALVEAPTLAANKIALRMLSPVQHAALPKAERERIDLEVPDDALLFVVEDPAHRLVGITFLNEAGRAIRSEEDNSNDRAIVLRFNKAQLRNARLRLYIATPKATVKVPFSLLNIELP